MTVRDPIWKTAGVLLNYKRQISLAVGIALLTAVCFGGGIGMVLPTMQLLLGQQQPLHGLIEQHLTAPDQPEALQQLGHYLLAYIPTDPYESFVMVMISFAVLTVVGSIGRYLHELLSLTVVARAVMVWRGRLFRRLIHARMDQVMLRSNADHISRVIADAAVLGRGLNAMLGKALAKLLNGAAALAVAVWIDWRLSLIAMVGLPLIAVLLRKFGKKIRRASNRLLQQQGRMIALLNESLGGIRVVKVHHAEGYERRRFARINRKLFTEEMRMRQVRAMSSPIVETLGLFGVMLVATIAAWYIFRQDVTPAHFMTVLAALGAAAASLKPITDLNNQLQEANAAAARILDVIAIPTEPTGRTADQQAPPLGRHSSAVVFDRVSFTYGGQERPAVREVELSVTHGQTIAIVGANGSGKTTLLSLVPRLLDPSDGRVLIDGTDIAAISLRSLRQQIAVVTQQTVLFEGTIAQNIAYGRLYEPIEKIVAAAKAAYAHEFIQSLPKKYQTVLGEGGEGLSGGQRQRLCIARAILRDPAILILDEATSQIDADSEAKINRALNDFRHGRTTFIIAHRLSTVIDADRIVVMDQGQIIDTGTHAQLLDRCDTYRVLAHSQLQAVPAGS